MRNIATYGQILGQLIRYRRKALRLNQEDLGRRIGMTESGFSRLETGVSSLTISHVMAISEALECKPSRLLEEVDALVEVVAQHPFNVQVVAELPAAVPSGVFVVMGSALQDLVVALLVVGAERPRRNG